MCLKSHKRIRKFDIIRTKIGKISQAKFANIFTFSKLYKVPPNPYYDILPARVNHAKYMVTDKAAYIGQ